MGPSGILEAKDGKFPAVFRTLADSKGTESGTKTWLAKAKAALSEGQLELCKRILEAYLEADPQNSAACLLLSHACQLLGDADSLHKSIHLARAAVAHASSTEETVRASVQLAVSLGTRARAHTRPEVQRQRDRAEGIQLLSNMDELAAGSVSASTSTSDLVGSGVGARGHYTLALLQAEQGQAQAALASAQVALRQAKAAQEPQLTALGLTLVALLLSSRRQFKVALSILTAAPSSAGGAAADASLWTDVLVGRLRAKLLAAQADTAGSLAALAQCKKLLSSWVEGRSPLPAGVSTADAEQALVEVWCELAEALAATGERTEALAAVDNALALRPWAAAARHALGAVREALGQYDEAALSYNEALALDPTHAPTLLRQGALHARRGSRPDLAAARDMLAEALRYDPSCAASWYQLGRVEAALEHRTEAEEHLMTAVRLASAAPVMPYRELPLALPGC